jgi:[lysine-biosynthesis-protein LysW]---L-2-aminoadipate ligase
MKIGLLYSNIRLEERTLLEAMAAKGIAVEKINDDEHAFELGKNDFDIDVLLERSLSFSKGLYISRIFEGMGIPVVNRSAVSEICGDKYLTTQALVGHDVPTPKVIMAFSPESALEAVEMMGYPCVIKPAIGSWGRLVSKIEDRYAAEAIIEHKSVLGNFMQSIFYVQEFIDKPGRDIRAIYVGGDVIAAIYRNSEHWITNTAKGGEATICPISDEITELCGKAADAVGGGILGIDLFETENGLTVNEINHTMEFKKALAATGVDIPGKIVDYTITAAKI